MRRRQDRGQRPASHRLSEQASKARQAPVAASQRQSQRPGKRAAPVAEQAKEKASELASRAAPLAEQAKEKASELASTGRARSPNKPKRKPPTSLTKPASIAAQGVEVDWPGRSTRSPSGKFSDQIKSVSSKARAHCLDHGESWDSGSSAIAATIRFWAGARRAAGREQEPTTARTRRGIASRTCRPTDPCLGRARREHSWSTVSRPTTTPRFRRTRSSTSCRPSPAAEQALGGPFVPSRSAADEASAHKRGARHVRGARHARGAEHG